MSFNPEDPFFRRGLVRRASDCKECPSSAPTCPSCPSGTRCTMTAQSCSQCASVECVKLTTSTSDSQGSSSGGGTNKGAIAGGVIGGLAAVGILTFLIWWFVIRKKRNQQRADQSEKASSYAPAASQAQSRKSTHSIASTVLTRASNVIQIAYIPGVTNRSPPDTPLVPPVPPIPGASPDQHFFMPGDLRDSSWSDMTTDRRSMAQTLRSSVATTIYRNDAIVSPMPAQQAMRTRAAVVSIHNGGGPQTSDTLAPDAPAVPAITQSQLAKAGVTDVNNSSSIVARTVTAKPVMVKTVGKKNNTNKTPAVQPIQEQSESSTDASSSSQNQTAPSSFDVSSSSDSDSTIGAASNRRASAHTATRNSGRQSRSSTVIEDSPAINQSPFADQTATETNQRHSHLLDGSRPSSKRHSGAPPPRVESPFADVNEVK
ncbi:hypothetical protein BJX99DRAFT_217496 [Aspergillus californicus]